MLGPELAVLTVSSPTKQEDSRYERVARGLLTTGEVVTYMSM